MAKKYILVIFFLFLTKQILAQGEAALPFLNFQQSPILTGAGQIGVSIPTDDASGFYYNPAVLGYSSKENHVSLFYIPANPISMSFPAELSLNSFGVSAGYNFKEEKNLPLSLGFGYIYNKFDYAFFPNEDIYDEFHSFSFGAGYEYYLLFNLGFSLKYFNSVLGSQPTPSAPNPASASGLALDFGTLITVPISKLAFCSNKNSFIKPLINFSLGYSISNLGGEVSYTDPAQADPLPRTARFGYTFDLGAALNLNEREIDLINYSFTAEAHDILVERNAITDPMGNFVSVNTEYQGLFGDIKLDHIVSLEGDNNVSVHKGHLFRFFETITIADGSVDRHYTSISKTSGIGFSTEGLFKILSAATEGETLDFIADHLSLEYYDTIMVYNPLFKINYKGISVKLKNIIF